MILVVRSLFPCPTQANFLCTSQAATGYEYAIASYFKYINPLHFSLIQLHVHPFFIIYSHRRPFGIIIDIRDSNGLSLLTSTTPHWSILATATLHH